MIVAENPETRTHSMGEDNRVSSLDFGDALSVSVGLGGEYWRLSLVEKFDAMNLKQTIDTLAEECLEPNPFAMPDILGPAIENLAKREIKFLCLVRHDAAASILKFFMPVTLQSSKLSGKRILRAWTHPFGPLGTPLTSRHDTEETFQALSHCLFLAQTDRADALIIDDLPKNTSFSTALHEAPLLSGRLLRYAPRDRAGIHSKEALQASVKTESGSRKQRLNSAFRKLGKLGVISYTVDETGKGLLSALLDHVQIEHEGWKGRRGTSILSHENHRDFVFSAVSNLAQSGNCRIHSLRINGVPIASLIEIRSYGHIYPWKIAFDEQYAKYSAGNLLIKFFNNSMLGIEDFKSLDSLASELNNTAGRFWPDGQKLTSMVVGFGQNGGKTALQIARREQIRATFKRSLKQLTGRLL